VDSILYGNFRLEVSGGAGSLVHRLAKQPSPGLLPRPRRAPESVPAGPAGRDEQLHVVRRARQAQRPVGFYGACGYGKTTLLRHVAASATADGLAQPGVYLPPGRGGLRDLLHRLVTEFYTADQPVKLTPDQCVEVLSQVQALVAADDVELTGGQADYLQSVLPGCSLVLSSRQPVLGEDDSHQLGGLPDEAALQLVIDDLGRPLSASEMAGVRLLIRALDGQPLHLRQATALAREGRMSFTELAEAAERDPGALDRHSVEALGEPYRGALAILALAAGALLPIGLVAAMGGIAEIGECLSLLHRRGLAERQQDQFGLPVCKAERYRQMLLKDVNHAAALRELTSWLTTRNPTAPDSVCAASAAVAIAEWAAEGGDWPGVIALVRVAEPILTLAGHWETSRQALTHGLHAAVNAADHLSEALFTHQQGTLALCLDELTSAQHLLSHALRLREQHGDDDGAAVTRHNLEILQPPAAKTDRRRPRSTRRVLAVAAGSALTVLAIAAGVVKALPPSTTSSHISAATPSPTASPSITLHHDSHRKKHHGTRVTTTGPQGTGGVRVGSPPVLQRPVVQPLEFGLVDITGGQQAVTLAETVGNPNARPLRITGAQTATPYSITADGCLAHRILPHGSCTIDVQFAPTAFGPNGQILTVDSTAGDAGTQLSGTGDVVLTITVSGAGSGSVSDEGSIDCSSGSCSTSITQQVSLTLTAAASGSQFDGWGGACQGAEGNTCQVNITADTSVGADFEPVPS